MVIRYHPSICYTVRVLFQHEPFLMIWLQFTRLLSLHEDSFEELYKDINNR